MISNAYEKELYFMDAKQNHSREITIVDIFFAIKKKIKLIAFVTLIAMILGAAGGVALTLLSNANYGTTAEFRIKSEENNDYILSLLNSDRFAEKMLLDKLKNDKKFIKSLSDEEFEEFEAYFDAYNAIWNQRKEIKTTREGIRAIALELAQKQKAYDDAKAVVTEKEKLLEIYVSEEVGVIDAAKKAQYEDELAAAIADRDDKKEKYDAIYKINQELTYKISDLKYDFNEMLKDFEQGIFFNEETGEYESFTFLTNLRNNAEYASTIAAYKGAMVFEFFDPDSEKVDSSALLLLNIRGPYDQELAEEIIAAVPTAVPEFVEFHISVPDNENATSCMYISVFDDASSIEYESPVIGGAKIAIIVAIVVFAFMCFGVAFVGLVFVSPQADDKAEIAPIEAAADVISEEEAEADDKAADEQAE